MRAGKHGWLWGAFGAMLAADIVLMALVLHDVPAARAWPEVSWSVIVFVAGVVMGWQSRQDVLDDERPANTTETRQGETRELRGTLRRDTGRE